MIDSSQAGLLGTGSFAEVRRGTYAFSTHSAPTEVAFKIFRGSQQLDAELRSLVSSQANFISLFGSPLRAPRRL